MKTDPDGREEALAWEDVLAALQALLGELEERIAAYPPPIAACDAQFDHLLESRGTLSREMARARALAGEAGNGAGGAGPDEPPSPDMGSAIGHFLESSPWGARVRALLEDRSGAGAARRHPRG